MIATRMNETRRTALLVLLASITSHAGQQTDIDGRRSPRERDKETDDPKLPNGKSQKDAISKQSHEEALKEAEALIQLAQELRDELKRSGEFVVPFSSVKKTEEIEKLARRIRGKLKA